MTRTANPNSLAVHADYADAMLTARRAKNVLFLLILLMLLIQIVTFFVWRYPLNKQRAAADSSFTASTLPIAEAPPRSRSIQALAYLTNVIDFLGITFTIVLAVVLLLIVLVMMVGRLIGVAHVTSAFIWCVVLAVLLFPWQAFLISDDASVRASTAVTSDTVVIPSASDARVASQPAFKIPGVLYTWAELQRDGTFATSPWPNAILKWARFVGFPVVAVLVLMTIQSKSSRGLKFALGESDVRVDVTAGNA